MLLLPGERHEHSSSTAANASIHEQPPSSVPRNGERHPRLDGIEARSWERRTEPAGRNKQSWPPLRPASVPLGVFVLVLKLLVDDAEGGEEVPQEEDEEGETAHEDLQEAGVSGGTCLAQTPPPRAAAGAPPLPATPCTPGAGAS